MTLFTLEAEPVDADRHAAFGNYGSSLQNFHISDQAEITMEMNPCDMTEEYLANARRLGINRLSVGVQSHNDYLLKAIDRRHDSKAAEEAVKRAYRLGFHNISIDLMYELPGQTPLDFEKV